MARPVRRPARLGSVNRVACSPLRLDTNAGGVPTQRRGLAARTRTLALFVSALFGLVGVSEGQVADHPAVASNLGLVEAWIEAQMAYRGLPGLSVGVVYDQELVYAKGFGYADVEAATPATPSTIYRIASHSKLFTAIAVLQLRDAGRVSLDEPIRTYLPWFKIKNGYEDAPPVTLRQILTHTSGLPREAGSGYWIDFDFPNLDEVRERLPGQEMVFPPKRDGSTPISP